MSARYRPHQITYEQVKEFRPKGLIAKNGKKELTLTAHIHTGHLFYCLSVDGVESDYGDDIQAAIEAYNSVNEYGLVDFNEKTGRCCKCGSPVLQCFCR